MALLEVPPGIEPGYTDLQSGASPLRHGTSRGVESAIIKAFAIRNS